MSKPQLASEPTLEEILSSIRKMISDDKPGPAPLPDTMGRTPFADSARAAPAPERGGPAAAAPAPGPTVSSSPTFNSLADALKVATALSDQRRSVQQEVASSLDKGPRSGVDALADVSARAGRSAGDERIGRDADAAKRGMHLPDAREPSADDSKRDLMSFDFGTVVPRREDAAKQQAGSAAPKPGTSTPAERLAPSTKADGDAASGDEPRVLQLRSGMNGSGGMNGAAVNVAPFARLRDTARPAGEAQPVAPEKTEAKTGDAGAQAKPAAASQGAAPAKEPAKTGAAAIESAILNSQSEALLDAVVELVQQQPSSLSVFASGASFISGVTGAKGSDGAAAPTPVEVVKAAVANSTAATAATAAPAKMDRAAAELLRPMLRQWLAENMGRILEEALRSELGDQPDDGKGPAKS